MRTMIKLRISQNIREPWENVIFRNCFYKIVLQNHLFVHYNRHVRYYTTYLDERHLSLWCLPAFQTSHYTNYDLTYKLNCVGLGQFELVSGDVYVISRAS